MSFLIDPYMFELSDEEEINDNISFFYEIMQQKIPIIIYKDLIDRMYKREIQPFPIKVGTIIDLDLKNTIMQINASFNNFLLKSIESVDIEDCNGSQSFTISDKTMMDDTLYYEMLYVLLVPCYMQHVAIDNVILTGKKVKGKQQGESFQLECNCSEKNYSKECCFDCLDNITPLKDKVIKSLRGIRKKGEIDIVENVPAIKGEHHNMVQANKKSFADLEELSLQNKKVLKLLRQVGLQKVIFGSFTPNPGKGIGNMVISGVDMMATQDIVVVKFYAETGYQIETKLYFPPSIGQLLYAYFSTEMLTYQNVSDLLEKIN